MHHARTSIWHAHVGMLVWTLIVGSSFPLVALLPPGLPILQLTALRFAIAVFVLLPLLPAGLLRWPPLRTLGLYVLMGTCLALFFISMFWAAPRSSALTMACLYVSLPVLTYTSSVALGLDRPARGLTAILLTGACGALLLALPGGSATRPAWKLGIGEVVFFLGCLASSLYPVLSKWGLRNGLLPGDALLRTVWSLLTGACLVAVLGLLLETQSGPLKLRGADLLPLLYLGVFSTGLTFWLTQAATTALSPVEIKSYSYLVPFVSVFLVLLHDPSQAKLLWLPGSVLVFVAMARLMLRARPRHTSCNH